MAKVGKKEGTVKFCLPCGPGIGRRDWILAKAPQIPERTWYVDQGVRECPRRRWRVRHARHMGRHKEYPVDKACTFLTAWAAFTAVTMTATKAGSSALVAGGGNKLTVLEATEDTTGKDVMETISDVIEDATTGLDTNSSQVATDLQKFSFG